MDLLKRHFNLQEMLPWMVSVIGGLLALYVILLSRGLINPDGVAYIEAAGLINMGNWADAQQLQIKLKLFYPLIIASLHNLTSLDYQTSAYLFTILSFSATSAGLLILVRELGGDWRTMLAAAALLFTSPYLVGDLLPMLVRDHGFWAAHVWSLVFFVRIVQNPAWRNIFGWSIFALLALMFRSEGLTYLLLMPLALSFLKQGEGVRKILHTLMRVYSPLILVSVVAVLYYLTGAPKALMLLSGTKEAMRAAISFYGKLDHGLAVKADTYSLVLGDFIADYALGGIVLTLLYVVFSKMLTSAGIGQLAMALYALKLRVTAHFQEMHKVMVWAVFLGLGNAIAVAFSFFLLPKRYLVSVATITIVYAAFGLKAIYANWRSLPAKKNFLFPIIVVVLCIQFLFIAWPHHPQSAYEKTAAEWIKANVPSGSQIYFDTGRMHFYATGNAVFFVDKKWKKLQRDMASGAHKKFDYVVVHVSTKLPEQQSYMEQQLGTSPLVQFDDGRHKKILVFKLQRTPVM